MIKLYGFGPAFGLPDPSPFVTKVDFFLRLNKIEYQPVSHSNNLSKAPKSKLPFIDDNGTIVADSVFIFDYLNEKFNLDIDAHLSDEQRAIAQLVGKSLDENLYWAIVHSRWINDDTWPVIKQHFFASMPFPMNKLVPAIARRMTRKQIVGHGMGKHNDTEIQNIAKRSLNSLSVMLGDKPYFFGDKVSSLDVTAFSMIGALTLSSLDNEMSRLAQSFTNLNNYTQQIKAKYYPEL